MLSRYFVILLASCVLCDVQYLTNRNTFIGTLGLSRGHILPSFPAYLLRLKQTYDHFDKTDLKEWAVKYPAAARLFGNTPEGLVLRGIAKTTGTSLFANRPPASSTGVLKSGEDFMKLIHNGRLRGDVRNCPLLYDFVLSEGGQFRFAPVFTSSIFTHIASKHATLSKSKTKVLYAGDMIVKDGVLYVSNDSGTYQPSFENMDKLTKLLMEELPGLKVIGMDYNTEEYKNTFEEAHECSTTNRLRKSQ